MNCSLNFNLSKEKLPRLSSPLLEDSLLTTKTIFVYEYIRQNFKSNKEISDLQNIADKEWENMSDSMKLRYKIKYKKYKYYFRQKFLLSPHKLNGYTLYLLEKEFLSDISQWNKLDPLLRNFYFKFASYIKLEIKKMNFRLINLNNEITNINNFPSVIFPWGPSKFYVARKLKGMKNPLNKISLFVKNCLQDWDKMSEDEKLPYIIEYQQDRSNYLSKKYEFLMNLKNKDKNYPKTAFNIFTQDNLNSYSIEEYKHVEFFDLVYKKWTELDPVLKIVYEGRAEESKLEFLEKIENNKILNIKNKSDMEYNIIFDSQEDNISTQYTN